MRTITVRNNLTAMEAAHRLQDEGVRTVTAEALAEHQIEGDEGWLWTGSILLSEVQQALDWCWENRVTN